jgi:hypothetical protein
LGLIRKFGGYSILKEEVLNMRLGAMLLAAFVSLSPSCSSSAATAPPAGWREVKLGDFTVSLPPGMEEIAERRVEGKSSDYDDGDINLAVEYNHTGGEPSFDLVAHDLHQEVVKVGGREAHVSTFEVAPVWPGRPGLSYDRLHMAVAYFDRGGADKKNGILLWAACRGPAGQETARKIFLTVRFR